MIQWITKIEIDHATKDVTFYFDDDPEPFSAGEFEPGSERREQLDAVVNLVLLGPPGS